MSDSYNKSYSGDQGDLYTERKSYIAKTTKSSSLQKAAEYSDPQNKTKILFVDDELLICNMAAEFLEFFGFDVDVFVDSGKALENFAVKSKSYDIVITDMVMPVMSGFDFLSEIVKIRSDIPKILCTGYSDQFEELKNSEIGIDAVFRKPYHFEYLIEEIRKLV